MTQGRNGNNGNNGNLSGNVRNGNNGNVTDQGDQVKDAPAIPAYIAALVGAQVLGATGELGPDEVHDVTVLHDDYCDLLAGRGACNCEPRIEVRRLKVGKKRTRVRR